MVLDGFLLGREEKEGKWGPVVWAHGGKGEGGAWRGELTRVVFGWR
jgi:hypothetical protein